MRVDLDAKVRTRDGESAGSVQRAIVDPRANEVTDFVISTGGLFGHDVLVPRERLEGASREGDSIRLDLSLDELKQMPRYEPADYTVPASGWQPPLGYAYPAAGFVWPAGYIWRDEPEVAPRREVFEGELSPAIDKGAVVHDRFGHEVGVVDDVRFDSDTGRLQALVIRAGGTLETLFGGGDTCEIDRSQVESVVDNDVYLRIDKDAIMRSSG